ncbi:hypothetical protein D3C85_1206500 [compost metagenome]
MSITQTPRWRAGGEVVHGLVGQAGDLHVEQRHIDVLAAAIAVTMGEGGQDRHGRVEPGEDVGQRDTDFHRPRTFFTFRAPGQAHQPAQALDHEVIAGALGVGPGLTKAGDRAIDQARVDRLQAFIVQPIGSQATNLEVLDQHIRLRCQLAHQALALGLGEVDGQRTLVAVGRQVVGSLAGVLAVGVLKEGRPPGARIIAAARALDLDHFGAEVGEYLPGPGPGQHSRQIQHPQMR